MPRLRFALLLAALALASSACRMTVEVTARLTASGAGEFRVDFSFDKEFVDVVETSPEGRESLERLRDVGASFRATGWRVATTEPDGGLRIEIARDFDDAEDMQRALADVAARTDASGAFAFSNVFRDFEISHSSGLFSTSSRMSGTVELTPERLAPNVPASAELKDALEQAAKQVLAFRVRLEMPGGVGRYDGDPESLAGGTIVWDAPFGGTLAFSAEAGGIRAAAVGIVAGSASVLLAAALLTWMRARRRRAAPVEGWEMPQGSDDGA